MFKNKKTKQNSVNTVDNLLSTYLQVSDKKILKNEKTKKNHSIHEASKIIEMNNRIGKFNENTKDLKKHKQKERKIRSKEMKKNEIINNKIIRQSKINKKDDKVIQEILKTKLKDINKIDQANRDEDLVDLQNDILSLTNVDSTKKKLKELRDKQHLLNRRKAAEIDSFKDKISKGHISIGGLTPGLAQVGDSDDSDSDEEDNEDQGNGLSGFKDDFDEYN